VLGGRGGVLEPKQRKWVEKRKSPTRVKESHGPWESQEGVIVWVQKQNGFQGGSL